MFDVFFEQFSINLSDEISRTNPLNPFFKWLNPPIEGGLGGVLGVFGADVWEAFRGYFGRFFAVNIKESYTKKR